MATTTYNLKFALFVKRILIVLFIFFTLHSYSQTNTVDIGLYKLTSPNTVQVKIRPNYLILSTKSFTGLIYTIRWTDPSIVISLNDVSPFNVGVNDYGIPTLYNGYYYMTFTAEPNRRYSRDINAGEEILLSSFTFTGGSCATFELINNDWTFDNNKNANYYFEVQSTDVTGIFYQPTVSFNAVAGTASENQVICNGGMPSDITLTGSNGDIQWQNSSDNNTFTNISGATSATLTSSQIGSLTAKNYCRALVTIGSCSDISNVVTLDICPTTNAWNGVSSDWNSPANWSAGVVPLACNDIIIPYTDITNFPVISEDNVVCNNLTISPGAKLTLNDGKKLTASGNLLIESNKTMGTGTFVDNNATGGLTIGGTTTVQQFLTGSSALARFPQWYISSPVVGATSTTFDALAAENKLFYWTESTHSFTEIEDNISPLVLGKGYIARMGTDETTVNFTGTGLNTGPVEVTGLTYTGTTHNNRSYHLIGNPYPSFLDWDDLWNLQTTLLRPTLFIRYADGSLHYYNAVNGTTTNTSANSDIKTAFSPGLIAPLQSFWVEVVGETIPGNEGTISFKNANRSHQPQPANKLKAPAVSDTQLIRLQVSNGAGSDETVILFNEKAQNKYDLWDSHKMFTGIVPEIYTMAGVDKLAINGLNSVETTNVIPLGFRTETANSFNLSLSELQEFKSGTAILLIDNNTLPVTVTNLTAGSYTFNAEATDNSSRFTILIKAPGAITKAINPDLSKAFVYSNKNQQLTVICNETLTDNANAIIFNSMGQQISTKNLTSTITVFEDQLTPGVYLVKVKNGSKSTTEKVIIK